MKKVKKKKIIVILTVILLSAALLFGLFALAVSSVIGVVERIQGSSVLITVAHPTLFWMDPDMDEVWLRVDRVSRYRVGDVIFAIGGNSMLDTDPPRTGTKWSFRIVRQDFRY